MPLSKQYDNTVTHYIITQRTSQNTKSIYKLCPLMYKTECNATIALDPEIAYNNLKGIKMENDLCLDAGQYEKV